MLPQPDHSLRAYLSDLREIELVPRTGEVIELVGLLVESRGPAAAIGDFCDICSSGGRRIRTQVVGFRNGNVLSISQDFSENQGDVVYEVTVLLTDQNPAMRWGMTAVVKFVK